MEDEIRICLGTLADGDSTWICLALQISVWLIPNIPLNAIAFSFIGMFLGPIYPSAVMIISETLPLDLQLGVIALMGSIGGGGGAAMPLYVTFLAHTCPRASILTLVAWSELCRIT